MMTDVTGAVTPALPSQLRGGEQQRFSEHESWSVLGLPIIFDFFLE